MSLAASGTASGPLKSFIYGSVCHCVHLLRSISFYRCEAVKHTVRGTASFLGWIAQFEMKTLHGRSEMEQDDWLWWRFDFSCVEHRGWISGLVKCHHDSWISCRDVHQGIPFLFKMDWNHLGLILIVTDQIHAKPQNFPCVYIYQHFTFAH